MPPIEKLTPEQENLIPIYLDKWKKIAFSTNPIDRQTATTALNAAYAAIGLSEPEIVFFDSPYEAWKTIALSNQSNRLAHLQVTKLQEELFRKLEASLKKEFNYALANELFYILHMQLRRPMSQKLSKIKSQLESQFYFQTVSQLPAQSNKYAVKNTASIDPYFSAAEGFWLDFLISVIGCPYDIEKWKIYQELIQSCNWIFPYENLCLVGDRPIKISLDDDDRLHAQGEPAIEFADGFKIYAYHNLIVPEKYGKVTPDRWQAKWLLEENNPELLNLLHQFIDFEQIIRELPLKDALQLLRSKQLPPGCCDKWRNIALSTERIDRGKATQSIQNAYKFIGKNPPEIVFYESPYAAWKAVLLNQFESEVCSQLKKQIKDLIQGQVSDQIKRQIERNYTNEKTITRAKILVPLIVQQLWEKIEREVFNPLNKNMLGESIGRQLGNALWYELYTSLQQALEIQISNHRDREDPQPNVVHRDRKVPQPDLMDEEFILNRELIPEILRLDEGMIFKPRIADYLQIQLSGELSQISHQLDKPLCDRLKSNIQKYLNNKLDTKVGKEVYKLLKNKLQAQPNIFGRKLGIQFTLNPLKTELKNLIKSEILRLISEKKYFIKNQAKANFIHNIKHQFFTLNWQALDILHPESLAIEANWFDFAFSVLLPNYAFDQSRWQVFQDLVKECGWIFPFEKVCYVCDRPRKLSRDVPVQGEPIIQFADGFSVYSYDRVILPEKYGLLPLQDWKGEWYWEEPSDELRGLLIKVLPSQEWQAKWLLEERNTTVRQRLIQGIGYVKIFQELQATELDAWAEYTLLKIDANIDTEPIYLLKMVCPSTGHIHVLRVPPDMQSAREAIRWVNGGINPEEFSVQT